MADINTTRSRDAYATIRGFVYQVRLTIWRLLDLEQGQTLFLEAGEDIDTASQIIGEDGELVETERLLEQVKQRTTALTLTSEEALSTLAGAVEHINNNPGANYFFRYVTNAGVGKERRALTPELSENIPLITLWQQIQRGQMTDLEKLKTASESIKQFLIGRKSNIPDKLDEKTWQAFQTFLENSKETEFLDFVRRVDWSTEEANVNDLEPIILQKLETRGFVADARQARLAYQRLFTYVFSKLSQSGTKQLTSEERSIQLSLSVLNSADQELLDRIEKLNSYLENRLSQIELQLAENSQKLVNVNENLLILRERIPDWKEKFSNWEKAQQDHIASKKLPDQPQIQFVGRGKELAELQALLTDNQTRIIVVAGSPTSGKSRLVLEATSRQAEHTLVAVEASEITTEHIRLFQQWAEKQDKASITLVIFNPDYAKANSLILQPLTNERLKLVITLSTTENIEELNYDTDSRLKTLRLNPLSRNESEEVLTAVQTRWNFAIREWVINQANGNPGLLLAAASLGDTLQQTPSNFTQSVAEAFVKKLRVKVGLDEKDFDILKLLSLLRYSGVKDKAQEELKAIIDIFNLSTDVTFAQVRNRLPKLIKVGVVRELGFYVEVVPPLLANHLAGIVLQDSQQELEALFSSLRNPAQIRLANRLRQLNSTENVAFWESLLHPGGILANWDITNGIENWPNANLLSIAAQIVPKRVMEYIESFLEALPEPENDTQRKVYARVASQLSNTLKELLLDERTDLRAIESLSQLAQFEDVEKTSMVYAPATYLFLRAFEPQQPFIQADLNARSELLAKYISAESPSQLRLLALKAINTGLERSGFAILYRADTLHIEPEKPAPTQFIEYYNKLIDLLMKTAGFEAGIYTADKTPDNIDTIRETALRMLPQALSNCFWLTKTTRVLERLLLLAQQIIAGQVPIPRTKIVWSLRYARTQYQQFRTRSISTEINEKLDKYLAQIEELLSRIDQEGNYLTRLKRWAGEWTHEPGEYLHTELKELAQEAVENREALDEEAFNWLCSSEAKKAIYFFQNLGQVDLEEVWLSQIEEIGSHQDGINAFSYYWLGLAQRKPDFTNTRLDELVASDGMVLPKAIFGATYLLDGNPSAVSRIEQLFGTGKITEPDVIHILTNSRWLKDITFEEFKRLIDLLTASFDTQPEIIAYLSLTWLQTDRPLEGDLAEAAWQILEKMSFNYGELADDLAARLSGYNPEKGFNLLKRLLTRSSYYCWSPFSHTVSRSFYKVLYSINPKQTLRTVLEVALENTQERSTIIWDFAEMLDQEVDHHQLLNFALESIEKAHLVASCLNGRNKGFWPLVFTLLENYPNNKVLQQILTERVRPGQSLGWGSDSNDLEQGLVEAKQVKNDPNTPQKFHIWVDRLIADLEKIIKKVRDKETNREIELWGGLD
jgi:hypothetical protein